IQVHIVDSTKLTGHIYQVRFSAPTDTNLSYDVIDENTSMTVLAHQTDISGTAEGPVFDGMRLYISNDSLHFNSQTSGWQRPGIHNPQVSLYNMGNLHETPDTANYRIEIGQVGLDTS